MWWEREIGNTPLKHRLARWNLLCFLSCSLCSHCSNFSINDAISSNLSKLCVHLIAGIHCFGLIWNLSYKLYFLKEHFRGRLQHQSNGAHSTLFSRICQLLECYLATQNNRICQRSRKQSKTVLETYKLYILTNDTKFTKALERFICVDVTNELHYLTECFNDLKLILT